MYRIILSLLLVPLGCLGGGMPSAPAAAPPPPDAQDTGVVAARDAERARRRAAGSNTIFTGPQGATNPAPVATKSLIGS